MKLIKGSFRERYIFAAAKYAAGCLKLVPHSHNLVGVVMEGTDNKPSCQFNQVQLRLKESGGNTFIATFAAA